MVQLALAVVDWDRYFLLFVVSEGLLGNVGGEVLDFEEH